ncbi:glycosyltransferase [Alicyclobacillus sp. SP_1]|uniref:glycosyltransferase family 2 protein n=1 Tax=Alicyclobacillus sp. SP_1 TaxID=2942475 RepID=UPI002157FCBE|nr:glycosyltransferase [Alicyclobacillus sp. SP_1]
MDILRPRVFVELGTHKGDSYFAFCQAVKEFSLNMTRCYAVDTWNGDPQAGIYGEKVFSEFREHHDENYATFSTYMKMTFNQAASHFVDSSIDLLHIDGLHTYDAVKEDFMTWLPKMSPSGVILLHDTQVKRSDFGVGKLLEELSETYATSELKNSNGLGIVLVGTEVPEAFKALCSEASAHSLVQIFSHLGRIVQEAPLVTRDKDEGNLPYVQLYFGRDGEFDEVRSERFILPVEEENKGQASVSWTAIAPYSVQGLRVDPINVPAEIDDLSVHIRRQSGVDTTLRAGSPGARFEDAVVIQNNKVLLVSDDGRVSFVDEELSEGDEVDVIFRYVKKTENDITEGLLTALRDFQTDNGVLSDNFNAMKAELESACASLENFRKKIEELSLEAQRAAEIDQELGLLRTELKVLTMSYEEMRRTKESIEKTSESLNEELKRLKGTKGWRALEVLRTVRNQSRNPRTLAKKIYTKARKEGIRATAQTVRQKMAGAAQLAEQDYNFWQHENERVFLTSAHEIVEAMNLWENAPLISVIIPTYNSKPEWLDEAINSILRQPYPHFEILISDDCSSNLETREKLGSLCQVDDRIHVHLNEKNRGISGNSNVAMENARGDVITFLDHDDVFAPNALYEIVRSWVDDGPFDILYSDEDKLDFDGTYTQPFFKPDFSPDYLLSNNYINHITAYNRELLERVGHFRSEFDGSQDHDLLLRASEVAKEIRHIPQVLYHWRLVEGSTSVSAGFKSYAHEAGKAAVLAALERRGEFGEVLDGPYPGHYYAKRHLHSMPLVSIIIPMKDQWRLTKQCLDSLKKSTYSNIEIIVVDNGSVEQESLSNLSKLNASGFAKVFRYEIPFNYSRLNNMAVSEANGEYLLFLNNDIEVISPGWIEEMLQHAMRRSVGVVGAKLLYPDGRIQHAGVVLGIGGVANHIYCGAHPKTPGYFGMLADIRDFSAVTGACMMVPRKVFEETGGFDEDLAVSFNDVDLCLRIGALGYFCVFTPYAELHHHESASRSKEVDFHEIALMQDRWFTKIRDDPFYNRHLSLVREDMCPDLSRTATTQGSPDGSPVAWKRRLAELMLSSGLDKTRAEEIASDLWTVYCARFDLQKAFTLDASFPRKILAWAAYAEDGHVKTQELLSRYRDEFQSATSVVANEVD